MILRGIWIYEFAELEGMNRKESHEYKAWLARQTDRQRDPFGHIVEDFPRAWVPIGSTNEGGYLKDATGNRRFWPLTVQQFIDTGAIARDRDQLWAEAAKMEAEGVSSFLPRELWSDAGERQSAETSKDPWADTLRQFLAARRADKVTPMPANRVLASELYDALEIEKAKRTRETGQRLRTVMEAALGWTYKENVRLSKDFHGTGYVRD
jgi:predicted P-loop ATPase